MKTPEEALQDAVSGVAPEINSKVAAEMVRSSLAMDGYVIERKERIADLEKRANGKYAGC